MKQLLEFIPLIIFFALYKLQGIYVATGALIIVTLLQTAITWLIYKKLEKSQIITAALVSVFGGMTIFFQDDNFIKWKVTVVYVFFAAGLLISDWLKKPLIKGMLSKEISLPEHAWKKINLAWVAFFAVLAVVNIIIAYRLPLDVWVNFKVFGLMVLTLIYTFATGIYIYKHMDKTDKPEKEKEIN